MNSYGAIERAYAVHRSIPLAIRQSARPLVWSSGITSRPRRVAGDSIERLKRCHAEVDSGGLSGFTHIGKISEALFQTGFPSADPAAEIRIHEDLQTMLAVGTLPQRVPASQTLVP